MYIDKNPIHRGKPVQQDTVTAQQYEQQTSDAGKDTDDEWASILRRKGLWQANQHMEQPSVESILRQCFLVFDQVLT